MKTLALTSPLTLDVHLDVHLDKEKPQMPVPSAAMAAAKRAVYLSSKLAQGVASRGLTPGVSSMSKSDASPVTVADYASQAGIILVLLHDLFGPLAVSSVLAGQGAPKAFRVVAEEDAGTLEKNAGLLEAVVAAFHASMPPKGQFVGGGGTAGSGSGGSGGSSSSSGSGDAWVASDILHALNAGACSGGLGSEGEGEGKGYWVMDPIDGTKGFLRGGQYAVGLAYVAGGRPVLAAMACPSLPFPSMAAAAATAGEGGEEEGKGRGCLFAAQLGQGATQEALDGVGSGSGPGPLPLNSTGGPAGGGDTSTNSSGGGGGEHLVVCESFESGHSNHALSQAIAGALGVVKPPIRMDSMGKYGLVARGCGSLYLRFPPPSYKECVWDHAPGSLILQEAGGAVTDMHGKALDFSLGAKLTANHGVVGTSSPALHKRVLQVVAEAQAALLK